MRSSFFIMFSWLERYSCVSDFEEYCKCDSTLFLREEDEMSLNHNVFLIIYIARNFIALYTFRKLVRHQFTSCMCVSL